MKIEYKVATDLWMSSEKGTLETELKRLGDDGWELCGQHPNNEYLWIFKRAITTCLEIDAESETPQDAKRLVDLSDLSDLVMYDHDDDTYPNNTDKNKWYCLNVHYWDSPIMTGPVSGEPGGSYDVFATGQDFAEAVMNAIKFIESKGHRVDQVGTNL